MLRKEIIPMEIREHGPQWVVWKAEERGDGKPGKVPKSPGNGQNASVSAPETWASFSEAVEAYDSGEYQGIGFMLTESDPYIGVDLDDCRDPETGDTEPWALDIVRRLESYTEISPSGRGLRIFIKGTAPGGGNRKGKFELYSKSRFLTVTGDHLEGTPTTIEPRDKEVRDVHYDIFKKTEDEELIQRIKSSPQGEKFSKLMGGVWKDEYGSQSEADLALCSILSHWTNGDENRIDKIFRGSGLYRDKWDRMTGEKTYGDMTISKAKMASQYGWKQAEPEEEINPNQFFEMGTFVPKRLAEKIMRKFHIKSTHGTMWVYQNGVYKPNGRGIIEAEAQKLLGEETRDWRIREAISFIERETRTELPNPSMEYINLKNGRLNWRTNKLEPHDPKHFDIVQLSVEYDPDAECPEFDRYLETTLGPDSIRLAEEIMGYALVPETKFEKAFLLLGPGANGKSVFLDVIRGLLGENNVANVALQDLAQDRFKPALLLGRLVNIFADLDRRALRDTGIFKALVTGDEVAAEHKFKDAFQFKNRARLIFSANEMPQCDDSSYAFKRRWVVIPFKRVFQGPDVDLELRGKLLKPHELSGILNRALGGLRRLYENGSFTQLDKVAEERQEYQVKSSLEQFLEERVKLSPDAIVYRKDLYEEYKGWCRTRGIKSCSQKEVKDTIARLYPSVISDRKRNNPWFWKGMRLKE